MQLPDPKSLLESQEQTDQYVTTMTDASLEGPTRK